MVSKTNANLLISADWLLSMDAKGAGIFESGALLLEQDRINWVGTLTDYERTFGGEQPAHHTHYENCIISPGLINLHTHLDYSLQALQCTDAGLFDWIARLMENVASWSREDFLLSAEYGAQEALRQGTSFVVDSSYTGQAAIALSRTGLKGIVGLELFGTAESEIEKRWQDWQERFSALQNSAELKKKLQSGNIELAIAPHAPYTVCSQLLQTASKWSRNHKLPFLIHLSESAEEGDWIKGHGPGAERIEKFLQVVSKGDLDTGNQESSGSSIKYLERLGILDKRVLAAHCVRIDREEAEILSKKEVSIAHCPRSNARLRNGRAPLEIFRECGLRTGLGTDSLASNDNLSLLEEARFALDLHRSHLPDCTLDAKWLLALITIEAARAIGKESTIGSLAAGKKADIAVFRLEESYAELCRHQRERNLSMPDPYELLIRGSSRAEATYVDGKNLLLKSTPSSA